MCSSTETGPFLHLSQQWQLLAHFHGKKIHTSKLKHFYHPLTCSLFYSMLSLLLFLKKPSIFNCQAASIAKPHSSFIFYLSSWGGLLPFNHDGGGARFTHIHLLRNKPNRWLKLFSQSLCLIPDLLFPVALSCRHVWDVCDDKGETSLQSSWIKWRHCSFISDRA